MQVIPAIDIRGGRCTRLYQGDYDRESVFDSDPVDAALRWIDMGAERLHVIDLDGARDGARVNAPTVKRIVESVDVPVQVGGGIRGVDDARQMIDLGVAQVIFGTAAVEHPDEVEYAVSRFGDDRVCVSVDARDGSVRTRGWLGEGSIGAADLMQAMSETRGVRRFIYTDVSRDGTLSHPNFSAVSDMLAAIEYPIVVAGGIATVDDIIRLRDLGAAGAVTGMAIYTGAMDLRAAINAVKN